MVPRRRPSSAPSCEAVFCESRNMDGTSSKCCKTGVLHAAWTTRLSWPARGATHRGPLHRIVSGGRSHALAVTLVTGHSAESLQTNLASCYARKPAARGSLSTLAE